MSTISLFFGSIVYFLVDMSTKSFFCSIIYFLVDMSTKSLQEEDEEGLELDQYQVSKQRAELVLWWNCWGCWRI